MNERKDPGKGQEPTVQHPQNQSQNNGRKERGHGGLNYSVNDAMRKQHASKHVDHPERVPASQPRSVLGATEEEFLKQAKPKKSPDDKQKKTNANEHDGADKSKKGEEEKRGEKDNDEHDGADRSKKVEEGKRGEKENDEHDGADKSKKTEEENREERDYDEQEETGKTRKEQKKNQEGEAEHKVAPNSTYAHELERKKRYREDDGKTERSPMYKVEPVTDIDDADTGTPDNWIPRHSDLVRLTGKHPLNAETDTRQLVEFGLVTPNPLHYVRNHGPVPALEWETHTVIVDGLVSNPREYTMDEIASKSWINIPVTMGCDGNRRKEVKLFKSSDGFNWGPGGVGTAYWKGPLIRDILLDCGVKSRDEGANYVCFEGADELSHGTYGTSLPIELVMDERNDMILAYEMNNLPLLPDHGYPIRTILPGMVGGRTVKWLAKITVSSQESQNWHHLHDNRVYPSHVQDEDEAIRDGWTSTEDTIIFENTINSFISHPAQGEKISLFNLGKSNKYTIRGFAYSGGGRKVQNVEISLDGGQTWEYCCRDFLEKPIRHQTKWWTWCHWTHEVDSMRFLQCDEIIVRAWDTNKCPQPEHIRWNLKGFMNNCWYRVKREIAYPKDKDDVAHVKFVHPVVPGAKSGGWMKLSIEQQIENAKNDKEPDRVLTWEEVEKHTTEKDLWFVMKGKVYDVTKFLSKHPGGNRYDFQHLAFAFGTTQTQATQNNGIKYNDYGNNEIVGLHPLLSHAGKEVTEEFESIHSDSAARWAEDFCIAKIKSGEEGEDTKEDMSGPQRRPEPTQTVGGAPIALHRRRWLSVKLIRKKNVSHDTRRFTFNLPRDDTKLGLPVGKHILVGAHFKDKMVIRPYTPVRPIIPKEDDVSFVVVELLRLRV
ncbi:hypothetical protein BC938DRAFT_477430 [Jimgerdemannia flammicorona]|uniref:Nitrate reductase [NADPH] n=1 Tax=Jimgerdemannia flammicorona TaxID=994334 RepID=A0A433QPB1_9FUNG|nr:hypothetical protein BC938DRAFT_477430 [Jimgerdemannia flammicorona]